MVNVLSCNLSKAGLTPPPKEILPRTMARNYHFCQDLHPLNFWLRQFKEVPPSPQILLLELLNQVRGGAVFLGRWDTASQASSQLALEQDSSLKSSEKNKSPGAP